MSVGDVTVSLLAEATFVTRHYVDGLQQIADRGLRCEPSIKLTQLGLDLDAEQAYANLRALAERAGRILSREQLMELARGSAEEAFDRSIDVHVSRLRQKLGDDPKRPRLIKTVRGVGYLLAAGPGDDA